MIALLLMSALASEPPERPEPPLSIEGECASVVGVDVGDAAPGWWFGDAGAASCSALIVPLSHYQDLLLTESWAELVAQRYELDTMMLETQRDWYIAEAERLQQPVPFFSRPATLAAVGAVAGVTVVIAAAWSLSALDSETQ